MDHFGMGKSSGSSQVKTSSGPPQAFLNAYTDTYNQAKGLTQQPYQQYGGPMVAGFSPDQQAAFGTIQNSQGLAQPYYNQAASYMGSAATPISPMGFDNVANLPGLGGQYFDWAGQMAGQASAPISLMDYNIDPYLSPYTENVTNSLSNTFAANNAEQYNQIRGNAAAQGAFGGDREAVAAAETARQQDLAQQQTLAGISQQGFAQANQEFNAQQAADYQRQVAQKQYALASGQLGLGIGQGMWGEFNTQQQQDVAAQEASAYLQAQAGSGLANLGNLAQNSALSGAQAQMTAGGMQQQLEQQMLNVPYYQFMQQQAYPYQQAGWLANIAEGLGGASGGTGSTTYPGPSAISQIGGLATAGAGVYGLGSQQGWWGGGSSSGGTGGWGVDDFGGIAGGNPYAADGGAIARRAPGGSVGLGAPPEFGGAGIPGMTDSSYIPGASGMGTAPSSQGGGLSKMFMQPETTQTQSGGGGGGGILGTIGSIAGFATGMPWLGAVGSVADKVTGVKTGGRVGYDDGGSVPRGTGLAHGYASGGGPHAAAPIVADLTHIAAPSSFAPPSLSSLRPAMNYAPSFDSSGYPGALQAVPHGSAVPPPLSIPMSNGMLNRAALNPVAAPVGLGVATPAAEVAPDVHAGVLPVDMGGNLGGGGASGGHVGLGGIGHYDGGGMVYPNLSQGYIPNLQVPNRTMGPPKPPAIPGWKPDEGMSSQSTTDMLKAVKGSGLLNESMGGAVMPSPTPLQYDDGGMVSPMAMMMGGGQSPVQQRALMQQFQGLPTEKLRELAMRYPAGTPQGSAIQRALQMRQSSPSSYPGGAGPTGPYGPQGEVQPGTTAARGGAMGLADGGFNGSGEGEDIPNLWSYPNPRSRPGISQATLDILRDHSLAGMTPVERSLATQPSYGEGEVIPSGVAERNAAFAPENGAILERQQNGGREDALLRALWAARDYQDNSPTYPRINGMGDAVNWPAGSMARGGLAGYADGGYPWEDYIEPPVKRPGDERPKVPPTHVGLAEGGSPDAVSGLRALGTSPDTYDVLAAHDLAGRDDLPDTDPLTYQPPLGPSVKAFSYQPGLVNDVSGVNEQPSGGLSIPVEPVAPKRASGVPPESGTFIGGPDNRPMHYAPEGGGWKIVDGPAPEGLAAVPQVTSGGPDGMVPRGTLASPPAAAPNITPYSGEGVPKGTYGPVAQRVSDYAQYYGVPQSFAFKTAQVESGMGTNLGTRGNVYQLGRPEWQAAGGGDMGDLDTQIRNGMVHLTKDMAVARQVLGREPQDWESYIVHQQGAAGGPALLTAAPGTLAVDALAPSYGGNRAAAMQAITANGGSVSMTADQFVNDVKRRFDGYGNRLNLGATPGAATGSPDAVVGLGQGPGATVASAASPGAAPSGAPNNDIMSKIDKILKDIGDRGKSGSDLYKSPYLPLIAAGLGMMASRSPFPGVAIGEGGLMGIKALQHQQSDIPKNDLERMKAAAEQIKLEMLPAQMQAGLDTAAAFAGTSAPTPVPAAGGPPVVGAPSATLAAASSPPTAGGAASTAPTSTPQGAAPSPAASANPLAPAVAAVNEAMGMKAAGVPPQQIAQSAADAARSLPQPTPVANDPVLAEYDRNYAAIKMSIARLAPFSPEKLPAMMEQYQKLFMSDPRNKALSERMTAEAKIVPEVMTHAGKSAVEVAPKKEIAEFEADQRIREKTAAMATEPQPYEVALPGGAGSMTLVAPRSQVFDGTAPGLRQPLTTAQMMPQGKPATPEGRYDPDPESLIAVAPPPGVTAQKIEHSTAAKGKLEEDYKTLELYRKTAQEVPLQMVRINDLSKLLDATKTGKIAEAGYGIAAWAKAAGAESLIPKGYNPENIEQINKLATQLVFAQIKQIGGRVLVSEIDGLSKANPNVSLTMEANRAILQNVATEQRLAEDRYLNASKVFSRYKQLGNFDEKFIANTPAGEIEQGIRQQLAPATAQLQKPTGFPDAKPDGNGVWWTPAPGGGWQRLVPRP